MPRTGRQATTRRFDPDRRERIIEAALQVVEDRGVGGLTFRAVADRADVPLGSTTYHFADKDELVREVLRTARERSRRFAVETLRDAVGRLGLVRGIALLVEELTVRRHALLVLEHDLYLSALRNPALREESRKWSSDFVEVLSDFADPESAVALGYLFDGICMQSALFDILFFAADVEPQIALVLEGSRAMRSQQRG